jgi:hypothetical protein
MANRAILPAKDVAEAAGEGESVDARDPLAPGQGELGEQPLASGTGGRGREPGCELADEPATIAVLAPGLGDLPGEHDGGAPRNRPAQSAPVPEKVLVAEVTLGELRVQREARLALAPSVVRRMAMVLVDSIAHGMEDAHVGQMFHPAAPLGQASPQQRCCEQSIGALEPARGSVRVSPDDEAGEVEPPLGPILLGLDGPGRAELARGRQRLILLLEGDPIKLGRCLDRLECARDRLRLGLAVILGDEHPGGRRAIGPRVPKLHLAGAGDDVEDVLRLEHRGDRSIERRVLAIGDHHHLAAISRKRLGMRPGAQVLDRIPTRIGERDHD